MSRTSPSLLHSVRGRLILLVFALVAPALLLVSVLMFQAYRNERAAVADKLLSTARAVAGVVDGQIAEADSILKSLAAALEAAGELRAFDTVARAALAGDERWFVLGDGVEQQLINTRATVGTTLPAITGDADFATAMQQGRNYVSNLRDGPVAQSLVLHVSRPLMRDGQLKYSLNLVMLPSTFGKLLDAQRFAPRSLVSVVDRNARVVARSRDAEQYVGKTATGQLSAAMKEQSEGTLDSVTLDGTSVLSAFHRAPASGWVAIVAAPKSELFASARQLLWLGLGLSALLVMVAGAIAAWIIRGLARGVESLVASTEAVARGDGVTVEPSGLTETDFVAAAMAKTALHLRHTTGQLEAALAQEKAARSEAEALSETARALTAELDLQATVQKATDAATKLTGAKFGAFFYNVVNRRNESYVLYTLSGAPREAFEKFGLPRNTAVFAPTFHGEGTVRVADITADPRYGKNEPHHGMPQGHLAVRSYLAVPVRSRNGEVLGGLFFGHPEPGVFTERAERIATGIAAQAAIAVDNAKLYQRAQAAVERLNFSLSSLDLGEWDWDAATDVIAISPRTAAIYGLNPGQPYTREQMRVALHPEDRDRARRAAKAAAESGTDYAIEYRVNHPDRGLRWVAASGRPVFGADNQLVSMTGVVQDITDRKKAETVLRTQNEVLEQRVAERTLKLRETIGELEAFSYSISHDMRAPLRSMQGYAELLLKDYTANLDESARRYLSRISANATRLDLLVRDVLAYSKVAKEEIELKPVALDTFLPPLVQQMSESTGSTASIVVWHSLPRVLAHEAYLSQIFTNLVTNAVKFVAREVRPHVEIAATEQGDLVRVTVSDNGIGIDPADFERIFQIFGRVHPDRTYEGTGIGLAIVKKAVQRMGGTIGLESTPSRGTTFWFTLARA